MTRSLTDERQLPHLCCDEDDGDGGGVSRLTHSLKRGPRTKVEWGGIVQPGGMRCALK